MLFRQLLILALWASPIATPVADAQSVPSPQATLASPSIFPLPGTYANTTALSLRHELTDVEFHYTWDGSVPTTASPKIDSRAPLFIAGLYEGDRGLTTGYTLRAIAVRAGALSEPATFLYQIDRRDRTEYVSEPVASGVRMVRDSDNNKMFLVCGKQRCALIDSGMGRGALRDYLASFTNNLPLIAVWTHSHRDHIGQADQFIADSIQYVGEGDRPAVADFLERKGVSADLIGRNLQIVADGSQLDLGGRSLQVIAVPGHTPGSIVVLDSATGSLFTGDSFGNNSPLPPDVMWMQSAQQPLNHYFAAVRGARAMLGKRVERIFTGHNDRALAGTAYLDNVERALQRAMDEGTAALIPSYRPAGLQQIVVGDRFTDPNWFGVNVNSKNFLPAPPDRIASLIGLELQGASLTERFDVTRRAFEARATGGPVTITARPASSRVHAVVYDGHTLAPSEPYRVEFSGQTQTVVVTVTAPDTRTTEMYRLTLKR